MITLNGVDELETVEFWTRARRVRRPRRPTTTTRRLGARDVHAVPVDQAGGLALRRHPQRHVVHWPSGITAKRRGPPPVAPRHRRRADDPRGWPASREPTPSTASPRSRWRASHGVHLRRRRGRRAARRRSTSRCSATAASTTTAGPRSPSTATPWDLGRRATSLRRGHLGALQHEHRLDAGARPAGQAARRSCRAAASCSSSRRASTTYCRWTTGCAERINPGIAGRPSLIAGRPSSLYAGMNRLSENVALNTKNRSYPITAEVDIPGGGARRRDRRAGRPHRRLALYGRTASRPTSTTASACSVQRSRPTRPRRGQRTRCGGVRLRRRRHRPRRRGNPLRRRDRGRERACGTHPPALLLLRRRARPRAGQRHAGVRGVPTPKGRFTRTIAWGQVDLGDDDHSHLIDPEDHLAGRRCCISSRHGCGRSPAPPFIAARSST